MLSQESADWTELVQLLVVAASDVCLGTVNITCRRTKRLSCTADIPVMLGIGILNVLNLDKWECFL